MRFAFFSKAAMEFMLKAGKRPDVIHTHDWQTGLVPVLLYEIYAHQRHGDRVRAVHTIHNFKHQGIVGENVLWFTGLGRPDYYFQLDRLRDDFNPTALNLTKGAIIYANFTTTVSPQHAWEALHTDQGYGLGHTLHRFRREVRRDAQRPRLRDVEPGDRPLHRRALHGRHGRAQVRQQAGPAPPPDAERGASSRSSPTWGGWTPRRACT